jgi:menaquinone-dependent protoporphyrinogen IX oxidase
MTTQTSIMPKVLVVCYSRSGRTRALGEALAARLHADFEEITEPHGRPGPVGVLRALADTVLRCDVRISPSQKDVAAYDVVVIGTPVWAGTLSAPVRAWLATNRRKLRHVAFFCTRNLRARSSRTWRGSRASSRSHAARSPLTCARRTSGGSSMSSWNASNASSCVSTT